MVEFDFYEWTHIKRHVYIILRTISKHNAHMKRMYVPRHNRTHKATRNFNVSTIYLKCAAQKIHVQQ